MSRARRRIEAIAYAAHRPLPVEVLTLEALHARRPRDLSRPERPEFHLVLLATRGESFHVVDFVRHPIRRGQLLTVAAGCVQQFAPASSFDALMLVCKPDAVRWRPEPDTSVLTPSPQRLALLTSLFEGLERELAPEGGHAASVATRLADAIGAACAVTDAAPSEARDLVRRFRAALDKHVGETHEVAAYAAILRVHARTLTRHCLATTGLSAKQMIDERVSLEARRSLAHEDVPVAELAGALGFGSATQFVKFFRRLTGQTPSAFLARFAAADERRDAARRPA
ncbi:MAG: helix-turn-helix domain-containing protein [Sandaracinus sp.]